MLLCVFALIPVALPAATNDLSGLLQRGLFEEEANRNLDAACAAYETLVKQLDKDRQIGATAIFRLGEVYRKQGKTNEAAAQYERIVRDFAEQTTLVTLSRQNLAGLGVAPAKVAAGQTHATAQSPEAQELERSEKILAQLSDWDLPQLRKLIPTLVPDAEFERLNELLTLNESLKPDDDSQKRNVLAEGKKLNDQLQKRAEEIMVMLERRVKLLRAEVVRQSNANLASEQDVAQLRKLSRPELLQVLPTLMPDQLLTKLLEQLGATETKLAELKQDFGPDHPQIKQLSAVEKTVNRQIDERVAGILKALELRGNVSGASKSTAAVTTVADEEEAEIRRIQAMIQNSPDLINTPGEGGVTPLGRAASAGWLRVVTFLLENGARIESGGGGSTPLHLAALAGHRAMVELLLNGGAKVNSRDREGNTPLHIAAERGFQSVAEVLLAREADANAAGPESQTPLHSAATQGQAGMLRLLLGKGADVNATDRNGGTALIRAALHNRSDCVSVLLEAGAKLDVQDEGGLTALAFAVGRRHVGIVTTLLTAKADPNLADKEDRTPLLTAVSLGDLQMVKALLAAQAKPDPAGNPSPLLEAVVGRRVEIAEQLLAAGADPNRITAINKRLSAPGQALVPGLALGSGGRKDRYSFSPLQAAVSNGDLAMIKLLLRFKANPNQKLSSDCGWGTPLDPLVRWVLPQPEILEALLVGGADANAESWPGKSLLSEAARICYAETLAALLKHGAKPDVWNTDGESPLSLVARRDCVLCVQVLLKFKANPNFKTKSGTPLLAAVSDRMRDNAAALIAGGADVNQASDFDWTPLHSAAANRDQEMLELLLTNGANPNVRARDGNTPLDIVKNESGRGATPPRAGARPAATSELAAVLRRHGALDDLPDFTRIGVSRAASGYRETVFSLGTNDWSHYTLRELIAQQLRLLSTQTTGTWQRRSDFRLNTWGQSPIRFPDFSRVVIHRTSPDGKNRIQIPVAFSVAPDANGKQKDLPLERGDVVEIPEADHPVSESWAGPSAAELATWTNALSRTVKIVIAGKVAEVPLTPGAEVFTASVPEKIILAPASFMVRSALDQSRLVRYSSDLTRVKVIRPKGAKGKRQEWMVDCSSADGTIPDLWLQDGDVIEVPDKP